MTTFSERLAFLGFKTYEEYLNSPHWFLFKHDYRRANHFILCVVCSSNQIELHHTSYERLGCEQFSDVIPLCRNHHEAVHAWLELSGRKFVKYTHEAIAALRALEGNLIGPTSMKRTQNGVKFAIIQQGPSQSDKKRVAQIRFNQGCATEADAKLLGRRIKKKKGVVDNRIRCELCNNQPKKGHRFCTPCGLKVRKMDATTPDEPKTRLRR